MSHVIRSTATRAGRPTSHAWQFHSSTLRRRLSNGVCLPAVRTRGATSESEPFQETPNAVAFGVSLVSERNHRSSRLTAMPSIPNDLRVPRTVFSLRLVIAVISLGLRPFETLSAARMAGRTVPGTTREIAGEPRALRLPGSGIFSIGPAAASAFPGSPEDFVFAFWHEP